METHRDLRWPLMGLAAVLVGIAILGGWRAGRASAELDERRLSHRVTTLTQEVSSLQWQLQQENRQRIGVTEALNSSRDASAALHATRLASELTREQAEANQYKSLLEREQNIKDYNRELLEALSVPGVKTIALRGTGTSAAYALIIPQTKLIFVASNLPKPEPGKEYQLWAIHKQPAGPVSAALFLPKEDGRLFLRIEDPTLTSDLEALAVTEEPKGGSAEPSGAKVLTPEATSTK